MSLYSGLTKQGASLSQKPCIAAIVLFLFCASLDKTLEPPCLPSLMLTLAHLHRPWAIQPSNSLPSFSHCCLPITRHLASTWEQQHLDSGTRAAELGKRNLSIEKSSRMRKQNSGSGNRPAEPKRQMQKEEFRWRNSGNRIGRRNNLSRRTGQRNFVSRVMQGIRAKTSWHLLR